MKLNYIFHKFLEELPERDFSKHNLVVCDQFSFCPEDKLILAPMVVRGSIAFVNTLEAALRGKNWPCMLWPFNEKRTTFGYSNWCSYCDGWQWMSDMLNDDARMWYCGDTPTTAFLLFKKWDYFVNTEKVYIRSESGQKMFSGALYTKEEFEKEYNYLKERKREDEWLVIASPKILGLEWRFFVVNGQIISGSQYMNHGEPETSSEIPQYVWDFGQSWVNKNSAFLGTNNYVLDICEKLENENFVLKVVELNSIRTSGAYDTDMNKVIGAIEAEIKNHGNY